MRWNQFDQKKRLGHAYVVERPSFSLALRVSVVLGAETPALDFLRKVVEDEAVSVPSAILFLLVGGFESLRFG